MSIQQEVLFILHSIVLLLFRLLHLLILAPLYRLLLLCFGDWFEELDRNYRLRDDWYIIPKAALGVIRYLIDIKRHEFHGWYVFIRQVNNNGDRPAIRYARPLETKGEYRVETYTYKETYDIVLRLSYILHHDFGVNSGDSIGLNCTNKPLFIFLWFAMWNIGAVPAFMNCSIKGHPLVHSLEIASISQVFTDPDASGPIRDTKDEIKSTLPNLQIHYLDETKLMKTLTCTTSPVFLQDPQIRVPPELTDFKPAMLIYTSGTTGLPKSAIMSWRKVTIACTLFAHAVKMTNKTVVFTTLPLFHSTAGMLGECAVLSQGGCLAMANKFSASNFWKQVYLTQATYVQYVGEICRYLLHTPVSKYEKMHKAKVAYGNGLRIDIWQQFKHRFNIDVIGEFYAATEAPLATTTYQRGEYGTGACKSYGKLINTIMSIQQTLVKMDPNDECQVYRNEKGFCEVPNVGEPGEMLMRIFFPRKPEITFQGYLGNEKATKSKVLRNVFRNGDAWYRCGDLFKSDEKGLWYFLDRIGDTFRWKSENVSTAQVENQMIENSTGFYQIVVVGIKVQGYEGRAGFAIIRLNDPSISDTEKLRLLNEMKEGINLPSYAIPLFVKFVDMIITTDNYKIKKNLYRKEQLPGALVGKDKIFWLENYKEYKVLTDDDWKGIEDQSIKL